MSDLSIVAGNAIEKLMRVATARLSKDELRRLMSFMRSLAAHLRSERKAMIRSRRNSMAVKRYAHGRTQRTRSHHGQAR